MGEKIEITPLKDKVTTNIVTYGDKTKNCLVVETVASYYNFFNFMNTPTTKSREYKENYVDYNGIKQERIITEKEHINYDFSENPTVNLVFNQVIEIVINGEKRTPKSKEDLAKYLTIYPEHLHKILEDIKKYSSFWEQDSDKGLAKKN